MIWTLTSVAAVLPLRLKINSFRDSKILTALGSMNSVEIGQNLGVRGQGHIGLIGFVRIVGLEKVSLPNGPGQSATTQNLVVVELIRGSQYNMIRIGDELVSFDLSSATEDYMGSTELIVREEAANTSARFKPLFTQGILIGETAQTLANNEFMFTWYGLCTLGWPAG